MTWHLSAYVRMGSLALVVFNLIEPPILLIGGLDTLGAIWTFLSLRSLTETKEAVART